MSSLNRGSVRKVLAVLVALILSTFGLAGMAAANEGSTPEPTGNPLSYGNIDEDATGSITVHKHLHQTGENIVEGDVKDPREIPSDPVEGVVFTAYPLLVDGEPVDLTDPAAWDGLESLMPGDGTCEAPDGYTKGDGIVFEATDANGEATLSGLSLGVYLVCETSAPDDIVETAMPFIVTIPYPYSQGWIYDVHAYPKNTMAEAPTKTIEEQAGLVAGSEVRFPVTVKVPTLDSASSYQSFTITDTLDPRLTPSDPAVVDSLGGTVTVDGQTITVTYTAEQFAAMAGTEITVVFVGIVNEDIGDGEIDNTALVNINDKEFESNTVTTNWGDLVVLKLDSSKTGATLEGAVFDLYAAEPPYGDTCDAAVPTGDALYTGLTTDADGKIRVSALFVSDSENAPVNADFRCYVLVETQAPAGYVTPEGNAANFPVAVKVGQTADVDIAIDNVQQDVPELPLTGSSGAMILTIIGVVLIGGALMLIMISRRKTAHINA